MEKLELSDISVLRKKLIDLSIRVIDFLQSILHHKNLYRLKKNLLSFKGNVIFIIEEKGWAIEWDAKYITRNLKKLNLIDAEIATNFLVKKKIIHWGSINCLILKNHLARIDNSNINVLTWFHLVPNDYRIKYIPILKKKMDILHTSCEITRKKLINYGYNQEKIIVTPTGVDLNNFKSYSSDIKKVLREKYKIPINKFVIGSFVKDGSGWEDGMEPKLIKGPDIFIQVVKKLHEKFDIHVLITGPSRGYVKNELEKLKIPFTYIFLENYLEMVDCYNIIDLYLITSRVEGGPKGSLEALASGVPLVSTKVGWIPELIKNGHNGFVAEVENVKMICKYVEELINNKELRKKFIKNGLKSVQKYSWENVAKNYYKKIYKKFII
jgi:glycosyltransferase involved in cell wall biosynthesis